MIKTIIVKANTPEERAKKIEEIQNINPNVMCKGTIYYEYQSNLYADIYFVKGETEINTPKEEKTITPNRNIKDSSNVDKFIPSKSLLQKWKNQEPSKGTLELLRKKGFSKEEISQVKSQYEAHIIIENLQRKNI